MLDALLPILSYATFFLVFASVFAVIVLGLNLQWGYTGLFNVGVAGFVAIGAYTSAILTAPDYPDQVGGFGLPVAVGMVGAMAASGLVALVVGVAALRLRHDYLAITTFGIAMTIQLVALNAQWLTGGAFGLQFVPRLFTGSFPRDHARRQRRLPRPCASWPARRGLSLPRAAGAKAPIGRVLRRRSPEDETGLERSAERAFLFRLQSVPSSAAR